MPEPIIVVLIRFNRMVYISFYFIQALLGKFQITGFTEAWEINCVHICTYWYLIQRKHFVFNYIEPTGPNGIIWT